MQRTLRRYDGGGGRPLLIYVKHWYSRNGFGEYWTILTATSLYAYDWSSITKANICLDMKNILSIGFVLGRVFYDKSIEMNQ